MNTLLLRRRGMGVREPLTRIEYIESTGTQYMDIGIDASLVYGIDLSYMSTLLDESGFENIMGTLDGSFYISRRIDNTSIFFATQGTQKIFSRQFKSPAQRIYTGNDLSTAYLYSGSSNTLNTTYSGQFSQNNETIYLSNANHIRYYELILKDSHNDIIFYGVPVKRSTGEGCLYDILNDILILNLGGDPYVCGREIDATLPYDYVANYLSGTGTQFIDTLYNFNTSTDGLEIDARFYDDLGRTSSLTSIWETQWGNNGLAVSVVGNYKSAYYSTPPTNWRAGDSNVGTALGQVGSRCKVTLKSRGYDNGSIILDRWVNDANQTTITMTNPYIGTSRLTIPLFGGKNNSNTIGDIAHADIFGFKIFTLDNPKIDMIPVVRHGFGYMYEKVSNTLFQNLGTNSCFSYG